MITKWTVQAVTAARILQRQPSLLTMVVRKDKCPHPGDWVETWGAGGGAGNRNASCKQRARDCQGLNQLNTGGFQTSIPAAPGRCADLQLLLQTSPRASHMRNGMYQEDTHEKHYFLHFPVLPKTHTQHKYDNLPWLWYSWTTGF